MKNTDVFFRNRQDSRTRTEPGSLDEPALGGGDLSTDLPGERAPGPEKDGIRALAQEPAPAEARPSALSEARPAASWTPTKVINVRNYRQILTATQVLTDALAVLGSFICGYFLWSFLGPLLAFDVYEVESLSRYLPFLGVTLATSLIAFELNGLYKPQRSLMNVREFELILKSWIVSCFFSLGILFMAQQFYFSRGIFAATWSLMLAFLLLERYAFFKFNNYLGRKGFVETTVLIYGAGVVGRKILEKFRESPKLGCHVAGFIDDAAGLRGGKVKGVPVLGDFQGLRQTIRMTGATRLFIALPQVPSRVVIDIMNVCRETGCDFQIVPSLYDIVIQRVKVAELEGIPLIGLREPTYSRRTAVAKRAFDIAGSLFLLAALSPVLAVLSALVKIGSTGPIFFRQKRVGKNGRKFIFFKFRSMYVNSPVYAVTPQTGEDPRITPIGRFLRRSSLDELPQLWNVLKGDMSLVGPRPEMPFIVEKYNDLHRQRLNVKPGITGLWQISADRKNAIHENMDYDIYYINNQSLLLDIVILLRTAFSCIKGVGAC